MQTPPSIAASPRPAVAPRLLWLFVLMITSWMLPHIAHAVCPDERFETIGFDDFEDGDHLDGDPLCWTLVGGAGTAEVVNGRLVVCADAGKNLLLWGCRDASGDVSVRIEARLTATGKFYGVFAHASNAGSSYSALFGEQGGVVGVQLLRCDAGGGCRTLGVTALDPTRYPLWEDLFLQLDIQDGQLEVRMWRPGEECPASALLTVIGRALTAGAVGIMTRGCAEYEEFWVGTPAEVPPKIGFRRGDANGDAVVDISDAVAVLIFLFAGGETPACSDAKDIDDSGRIEISDGVYLLNHLFTRGLPPPEPYSDCGVDPTVDDLDCEEGSPCDAP